MNISKTSHDRRWFRLAAAALTLFATALPVAADHCHDAKPAESSAPQAEALGSMTIPDTLLLDQDGREVRFYSDLIEGRVVVMNFVFTTCTTICPPMGANFGRLQKEMGERVGTDFEMISVSVDPAVDTPQRLKAWAEKFGRDPGWTLVTGSKVEVDKLLKALKVFTPDKTDHSPILLLGDDSRGEWTRAYGLASPSKLAEMIEDLLGSREAVVLGSGEAVEGVGR